MHPLLAALLLSTLSQLPQGSVDTASTAAAAAQNEPANQQAAPQGESNRSVIEVKPGTEAIKPKDYYDRSGIWHPFVRMPKFILVDQKNIWTSPFHTARQDIKWWVISGAATAAFIATDRYVQKNAPNNSTLVRVGTDASYLGQAYTLLPLSAGLYFIGTAKHLDHFREAGLLSFEALADVTVIQLAVKSIADRARPYEGTGTGGFESSNGARWSSSFPSGHTISTFAIASVLAHEYPHHWWLKALILGYGAGVAGARLAANQHFPGDVVAGGIIGWFVGDYVYAKRHNPELDKNPSRAQKILSHVSIGGGM